MKNILFIGDPKGTHSLSALCHYEPENITVWENDPRHIYTINQICDRINVTEDLDDLINNHMKFSAIITNPPYQSGVQNGECSGSGNNAIVLDFINKCHKLLEDDGKISVVCPVNLFTGSKDKTKMMIGESAIYDVDMIDFDADKYFNVGQEICRWTGQLRRDDNTITSLSDGRKINLKTIDYLVRDKMLSDIVDTLTSYPGDRMSPSNKGGYSYRSVEKRMIKMGIGDAKNKSRDLSPVMTETHPYRVDFNGKIKYVMIKPDSYETPRILIPQLTNPNKFKFTCDENIGANGSTYVVEFDSMSEAQKVCDILNDPYYLWVINSLRIDGRVRKTHLETLPLVDIRTVLNDDQLKYIESQCVS